MSLTPPRMRPLGRLVTLLTIASSSLGAASAHAQVPDSVAPHDVMLRVFEGMRTADSAKIRAEFAPNARFATVGARGDTITYDTIDGWLRGVAGSGGRWDERVYDVGVRVDGVIAQVWAPYTFYLDRAVRHCGVNAVSLLRTTNGWKITQWSDSRRREGCPDPLGAAAHNRG